MLHFTAHFMAYYPRRPPLKGRVANAVADENTAKHKCNKSVNYNRRWWLDGRKLPIFVTRNAYATFADSAQFPKTQMIRLRVFMFSNASPHSVSLSRSLSGPIVSASDMG